ncbi:MAG: winged helix-turn-helix domain-containing protein [Anaerolineae bacterium]|nr:winged helix-turn-helix domain-containing protein [Anaerolineae bacterium]
MPATDLANPLTQTAVRVAVEPAHIMLNSLVLINRREKMPGVHEWVERTAVSLTSEQRHTNMLVMEGFFHAVAPHRSWSGFPAYLDYMEQEDPVVLRQRLFDAYEQMGSSLEKTGQPFNMETTLATVGSYLDYLYARFPENHVHVQIETEAYHLLQNPPEMQAVLVGHLRQMWYLALQEEWERTRPLLQSSAQAFSQLDFSDMTLLEAAQTIIGTDLPEWWQKYTDRASYTQFIFVPSPHIGPYVSSFATDTTIWLLFGARLPQGSMVDAPDLSRSELLVRLTALADDTRLRILQLLKEEGELCSQDVQQRLELSQSAGSRHMQQLGATGYVRERRVEGQKCYSLNEERIEDTLLALSRFLKG